MKQPTSQHVCGIVVVPLALLLLATTATLGGCSAGRISKENDRLRDRVLVLEDDLAASRGRVEELTQQLSRAKQNQPATELPDITDAQPFVTGMTIGRLSHGIDDDLDGIADKVIVYLKPHDGRRRFVQLAGEITTQLVAIDADGPRQLGHATLSPVEVRDAYRSGLTGTHYSIELAVQPEASDEQARIVVLYTDGRTGRQFRAEHTMDLLTPRPGDLPDDPT